MRPPPRRLERSFVLQSVRFGDRRIGHSAVPGIDPADERWLLLACPFQTQISEQFDISSRGIAQRLRGSARIRSRHIGDAIVGYIFFNVDRIVMRRRARSLGASALI